MARREVSGTGKGNGGEIRSPCKRGEHWSPRGAQGAIQDIETRQHAYYVSWPNGPTTDVHVVNGPTGKYLRTDRDNSARNNLLDLPNC